MPMANFKTCCFVAGTVCKDPTYRSDVGGGLLKITVRYDSEKDPDTEKWKGKFITVDVWGEQAGKLHGYINDGDPVFAVGNLQTSNYKDKTYYSLSVREGTVFSSTAAIQALVDAYMGGSQKLEQPIVSMPDDDDDRFIADDSEDAPF